MNNPSQSMGVGQPHHPINHTRPFFYVQPPTQPYYNMPQWNMNPYGQFGLPPSAMPYGRPYMTPYPYMQYPGYMIPQAPMQPVDYSRMFNPHISSASYDIQFRHHFQQQARVRRVTACSEVQTDPSDTIHKLIDGLDSLVTTEKLPSSREAMLASGMKSLTSKTSLSSASSGPTMSSSGYVREELCGLGTKLETGPLPQRQPQQHKRPRGCPLPNSVFSDSTCSALFHAESSQSYLEELTKHDCWSLGSGSPSDNSHIREDSQELKQQYRSDKLCLNTGESGIEGLSGEHPVPLAEDVEHDCGASTQCVNLNGASYSCRSQDALSSEQVCEKLQIPFSSELKDNENLASELEDLSCSTPRLPRDRVTVGMQDDPLWYVDSSRLAHPPPRRLSTVGSAYYYSYYPHMAPDRQSVLSLSMDELSSRDELFSTDADDPDAISATVYVGDCRLAESASNKDLCGKEKSEERFACSKTCLSCGSSLVGEPKPGKALGPCSSMEQKEFEDVLEEDYSGEEDLSTRQVPVLMKKAQHPNRLPWHSAQQFSKRRLKGCCQDHDALCHEEQGYLWSSDCCEEHQADVKADNCKGKGVKNSSSVLSIEKPWQEDTKASDQDSCSSVKSKPKSWRPYNGSHVQMRPPRRRPSCKTLVPQRTRSTECDNCGDSEVTCSQRGRGNMKRRSRRY